MKEIHLPQTAEELLNWPVSKGHDSFGNFTVITGYEGTGRCYWCGEDMETERRRYCKGKTHGDYVSCFQNYWNHFSWAYASGECRERYGFKCANCGKRGWLEIHHIIPLDGRERTVSPFNVPWNLICLCHECHLKVHIILNAEKRELWAEENDIFRVAEKVGQVVLPLMPPRERRAYAN